MAAELRRRGFSVFLLDAFTLGLSAAQTAEVVSRLSPRYAVGVSILETSVPGAAAFLRELRRGGHAGIVVGGNYYASLNPARCFAAMPELDCIIRGEGEISFARMCESLREGRSDWRDAPGCAWRAADGEIVDRGIAPQPDIHALAPPARDCLPAVLDAGGTANVVSGRGCYANCSFCSIASFFEPGQGLRRFRLRHPQAVAEEMREIARHFGVHRFLLPDDNFMPPGRDRDSRVEAFCHTLDGAGLEFTITCRANDIEAGQIRRLRTVGLVGVYLGLESFLPRRLKLFRKGLTPSTNRAALAAASAEGAYVKIGFIMFDPDSTLEEVREEMAVLRGLMDAPATVHTSIDNIIRHSTYPLELQAGTALQRGMAAQGSAFEAEAGWTFAYADPRVDALRRLAGALLSFEGRSFAVLRRLFGHVAYEMACDVEQVRAERVRAETECTALWRRLGNCHFDLYELFLDECGRSAPRRDAVREAIGVAERRLAAIDADGLAVLRRLGVANAAPASWLRKLALPAAADDGAIAVFDPVKSCWLALDSVCVEALDAWTRTPRERIADDLAARHGMSAAQAALAAVDELLSEGHFRTDRAGITVRDAAAFAAAATSILDEVPAEPGMREKP